MLDCRIESVMPELRGAVADTVGKWSNMRVLLIRVQSNNGTRLPLFHMRSGLKV
jgi:hypothetical protein